MFLHGFQHLIPDIEKGYKKFTQNTRPKGKYTGGAFRSQTIHHCRYKQNNRRKHLFSSFDDKKKKI